MNIIKSNTKSHRGFTLIELIIVIALMAILISWAFPSLRQSIQSNQVIAQNNEFVAMLNYARSEAIRRNDDIEVHLNPSDNGWEAYIVQPGVLDSNDQCQPGQLRCSSHTEVSLTADSDPLVITFNNRGYIRSADETWEAETVFLQHINCQGEQRRRIDIMATGQINSCSLSCNNIDPC